MRGEKVTGFKKAVCLYSISILLKSDKSDSSFIVFIVTFYLQQQKIKIQNRFLGEQNIISKISLY
ncbi:hypothetical protein D0T84_02910 [Dysgonomonas sp. 521]|nr:hypothetical protein [Dysgonomonas sp. 521]